MTRALLCLITLLFTITSASAEKPVLALVIDDLGYSFEIAEETLKLPEKHTFAVIPETPYSKKIIEFIRDKQQEVILHMPMQSSTAASIETFALNDAMSESELIERVSYMIRNYPGVSGINNHMGSRFTQYAYFMKPVMDTIRHQDPNLYFLDSKTTALSQAYRQARLAGIASLKRDVFLDFDHNNQESLHQQFERWKQKARSNGFAIAIAHPYASTLEFLHSVIPEAAEEFEFRPLSTLIPETPREDEPWPTYLSHLQKVSKNSKPLP